MAVRVQIGRDGPCAIATVEQWRAFVRWADQTAHFVRLRELATGCRGVGTDGIVSETRAAVAQAPADVRPVLVKLLDILPPGFPTETLYVFVDPDELRPDN